jgi:hypothetical protein
MMAAPAQGSHVMTDEPYERRRYPVPEEHRAFFEEFEQLVRKYPAVGRRYSLFDFGENWDRHVIIMEPECFDLGGMQVCFDKERPQ